MDIKQREAFIAGAREAFKYAGLFMSAPEARALQHWIDEELKDWSEGDPPPGPHTWLDE